MEYKFGLYKDGKELFEGSNNDCYIKLHNIQSSSWNHAEIYEGYAVLPKVPRLSLEEIEEMPVIDQKHFDNVIYDDGSVNILHSRMTKADGAKCDNEVVVLYLRFRYEKNQRWEEIDRYEAKQ